MLEVCQEALDVVQDILWGDLGSGRRGAWLDLHDTFAEVARADDEAHGKAEEIGVVELHAGGLRAVIEEDVDAGLAELGVNPVGRFGYGRVFRVQGDDCGLVRSDGSWEAHAALVMVLLDGSGEEPPDADAVAAHGGKVAPAFGVQEGGVHGLGEDGAELEDMADLYAAHSLEGAVAARAGVARLDGGDVRDEVHGEVPGVVDVAEVVIVPVGARDEVGAWWMESSATLRTR